MNRWTEIAGGGMSDFFLTDETGNLVQRKRQVEITLGSIFQGLANYRLN
ncbi:MAG: hypothetical protein WC623_21420 [Pedobacter sp.]